MSMHGFWKTLKKPIVGLSPMDGVTDVAFRYMVAKYGRPDVIYTEFVSVDAMKHVKAKGLARVFEPFMYDEIERPVVAQVFGHEPELFYQAAVVVCMLGFDGLDINMGCPAKKVEQHGSGAGLIRTPEVAQEIVKAAQRGIVDYVAGRVDLDDLEMSGVAKEWVREHVLGEKRSIPVSVKTRIGVEDKVEEWWMEVLSEVKPSAIAVHGRTLKQMYQGRADWEALARAAEVVHRRGDILFLGNGDVGSVGDVEKCVKEYGVDGVLLGRATFGNPGVFAGIEPDEKQRKSWMIEHARKYTEYFGENPKNFFPMRKHLAWYAKGFPEASELRARLMRCESVGDVEKVAAGV